MRRPKYVEPEDDGLVPVPHKGGPKLVTPEQAHARAVRIMAGFDDLSPAERFTWNYYSNTIGGFSASGSIHVPVSTKTLKNAGAKTILDEIF